MNIKTLSTFSVLTIALQAWPASLSNKYVELLPFVQEAPDQGETNTCWFMASTGAMELLLNKLHNIRAPKKGGPYDLSESFLIWQKDYYDRSNPSEHFIEEVVKKFNYGEAVLDKYWHFEAFNPDGSDNMGVWDIHPNFDDLTRIKVPKVKTELLFARGRRYATNVLRQKDIDLMKKTLRLKRAPLIVNYNDDDYWHVVLIVGYDDNRQGNCYQIEKEDCKKGLFYVRDSNGHRFEPRAYDWFLQNGNAAAVIELK
jgi:hypothetical protein